MDHKDFMIIYPSYLDSSKTLKQGRRIGKEHAVDTPTVSDISQALQSLGMKHVLQPHKGYSRDPSTLWDNPGRVKVEPAVQKIEILEDDDDDDGNGSSGNAKRRFLLEIASRIPSLPTRIQRLEQEAAAKKAAEEEQAQKQKQIQQQQQQQQQHTQKQQPSASSSKKKGKKKR
jgi:signal recognition particle subunit SRP19